MPLTGARFCHLGRTKSLRMVEWEVFRSLQEQHVFGGPEVQLSSPDASRICYAFLSDSASLCSFIETPRQTRNAFPQSLWQGMLAQNILNLLLILKLGKAGHVSATRFLQTRQLKLNVTKTTRQTEQAEQQLPLCPTL